MQLLYIPFLLVSIAATVIASQAMISGIFSVVYQGITTRIMPLLKIEYTSIYLRSQIYIDVVNWLLLFAVLFVIAIFRTSNNLTLAYGLAVSGNMAITGILIPDFLHPRGDRQNNTRIRCNAGKFSCFFLPHSVKSPMGVTISLLLHSSRSASS